MTGLSQALGRAVSPAGCVVPCVRFNCFVRLYIRASSTVATLGMSGWLDLPQQGLPPCKKRQASLGALALSSPLRSVSKPARNSDAAVFWIPAFAGMTSCPPFDGVYPELVEGLRTGSGGHPGFAQSGKPATARVQAASELCAVFT